MQLQCLHALPDIFLGAQHTYTCSHSSVGGMKRWWLSISWECIGLEGQTSALTCTAASSLVEGPWYRSSLHGGIAVVVAHHQRATLQQDLETLVAAWGDWP